ncbi:MAG TPA: 6-bladed beta-propeller [Longimicrobiales bacterium]|nr:6-bladed beta-propeller [Longimicrobiales bacterium]
MKPAHLVPLWPALLAACSSGAPPAREALPTADVRDSAGITIVENPAPGTAFDGLWRVAGEPSVSIGKVTGDPLYEFTRVDGAARLSDGGFVVVDLTGASVRIFDPTGVFVRSLGGRGEGPGEFNMPAFIGLDGGDTVVVSDASQRRITRYSADGSSARTAPIRGDLPLYPVRAGVLSDGAVIAHTPGHEAPGEEYDNVLQRAPITWASVRTDGSTGVVFGTIPGGEASIGRSRTGPDFWFTYTRSIPFAKEPAAAASRDRLYLGTADTFEILVFDQDGSLTRIIRMDHPLRPVTEDLKEALLDAALDRQTDPSGEAGVRTYYRDAYYPDFLPAYRSFRADALGYLWVQGYRPSWEGPPIWTVFDPEGRTVARLAMPDGLTVTDIGGDYVLGVERDEMDVQFLRLYGLSRGEP